jgi:lysyl-tRNA synthetase class I
MENLIDTIISNYEFQEQYKNELYESLKNRNIPLEKRFKLMKILNKYREKSTPSGYWSIGLA